MSKSPSRNDTVLMLNAAARDKLACLIGVNAIVPQVGHAAEHDPLREPGRPILATGAQLARHTQQPRHCN